MDFDPSSATAVEEFAASTASPPDFDPTTAAPVGPQSNAAADMAKRALRGAVAGAGNLAEAGARLSDKWASWLPDWMKAAPAVGEEHPLRSLGEAAATRARSIFADPARDTELKSAFAEGAGSAVPALAASAVSPVLGVATLAGQMGESERAQALAAGDSPEVAAEKAKIARLGGAIIGAVPAGPVRTIAGPVERIGTRAATGAAINAAQDVALQATLEEKPIDWGRVKLNGALGAGLGLILGVPEALALRRALGTTRSLEGKTMAAAIDEVAAETGAAPTEVQRRINQMVGLKEPAAMQEPTTAVRQIEAGAGVPRVANEAAETLFATRLRRQADAEAAFGAETEASMNRRAFDLTRARAEELQNELRGQQLTGDETVLLGDDMVRNQRTALDTRPGEALRERTRLEDRAANTPATEPAFPEMSAQARRLYDEHGSVDPAVLVPIARSALGGALGYASGDSPEERVRNALLGMGFGAVASPALAKRLASAVINAPVAKDVADLAQRRLTDLRLRIAPQSLMPEEIRTQLRWGEQAANAVTQTGLSLTRDLEQSIRAIGDRAMQATTADNVHQFLTGAAPAVTLPGPVRVAAQKVRDYVDALTDRAVADGVVGGSMANTFLSNKGGYLRRSYEIFLNPDYRPKPAVVDAAIAAVQRANSVARPEAEGIVAGILDKNSRAGLGDFLLGRGKVAGKDVSSVVRRQDLLPEVRALLGEVTDPILAANQTIPRMARLVEMDAAQRATRAIGLRLGLFGEARSIAHPTPLIAEGSQTHDVLAGLYAAPEIAAAMQREAGSGRTAFVPEVLWKTLTTASTAAKLAKTVGNAESYAPNFIGGIIANLGNANFRYSHAPRGLALGAEELGALRRFLPGAPTRDALRGELGELHKLGVVGESVNSGDLLRTIESSFFGRLRDRAASVLTVPAKIYGSVDDFNRYVAWQSERARYAKAFPGMAADELKRHAAEVVRATTPIYSEVPKVVKQLSVAGLAPSFVNFTWEVFRNTKNSVAIGLRDVQQGRATGNAALVRAGAERLAAITATTAAASMWGVSKLSRDSHGIDDPKDKAVRYFSPPWNRDGMLQYHSRAERGQPVQVSNLSYLVPHALLWQAIEAGRRGADDGQAVPEFLRALNEQFGFGNSVLIPPVAAAVQGFDPKTGRQIPSTAVEPTLGDRARYLAHEAFTPLAIDQAGKWRKAFSGEAGDYGRVYSTKEQMDRLIGVRAQTLDPVRAVQWKARDLAEKFQRAADIYRLRMKQQLPAERLADVYQDADAARRSQFDDMRQMITHARSLGVSDDQVIASLRGARVPARDILGAFDGHYTPLEKDRPKTSADYLADIQARPLEQRRAALAEIYRQDPAIARAVLSRVKEAAKGRSEADRLILSLGVEDGERAAYLRRKLDQLGDVEARRAWLLDLRRKGIVTDRVLQQMREGGRDDRAR